MKCPYCGGEMKISKESKDLPLPFQYPSCEGGFLHRHEVILWCGDKFLTSSGEIAREAANKGYRIRKEGDEYDIFPRSK